MNTFLFSGTQLLFSQWNCLNLNFQIIFIYVSYIQYTCHESNLALDLSIQINFFCYVILILIKILITVKKLNAVLNFHAVNVGGQNSRKTGGKMLPS